MSYFLLPLFILCDTLFLVWYAPFLDLSYPEVSIFYDIRGILPFVTNTFVSWFGQETLFVRLPFILIHALNMVLLWVFSKDIVKRESDRWIVMAIFALLPGVNSAALLVTKSGLILTGVLSFLIIHRLCEKYSLLFLALLSVCDPAFAYLSLGYFFYALSQKKLPYAVVGLLLFGVTMSFFGFDDGGRPKGHFLDMMGVFSTIFSPFVFLFFVYTIYRMGVKHKEKSLLWYIVATTFLLSLLFSFRQRVVIEEIAPLLVIALPLMVRIFFESYRTRLPSFRKTQKGFTIAVIAFLCVTTLLSFWHSPLYWMIENPKSHFAYQFDIASQLATQLKKSGISQVVCDDERLQFQLKFYGINYGGDTLSASPSQKGQKVSIFYTNQKIGTYYVTKVNN